MAITTCIIAEKGGVGKTTTTLELAYQLGTLGHKVLIVDLDQQANTTTQLTGNANHQKGLYDLFEDENYKLDIKHVVIKANENWPNCLVIPADRRLAKLSVILNERIGREIVLTKILSSAKRYFDFILMDTPPALGIGNVNALVASDYYLIPTDISEYGKDSIPNIQKLANMIRETSNPHLKCLGVIVTGFQKVSSNGVKKILQELIDQNNDFFLKEIKVPHSTKLTEAQSKRTPVGKLFPENSISLVYKNLAEILERTSHV
jgi:chromosome partitioning protein